MQSRGHDVGRATQGGPTGLPRAAHGAWLRGLTIALIGFTLAAAMGLLWQRRQHELSLASDMLRWRNARLADDLEGAARLARALGPLVVAAPPPGLLIRPAAAGSDATADGPLQPELGAVGARLAADLSHPATHAALLRRSPDGRLEVLAQAPADGPIASWLQPTSPAQALATNARGTADRPASADQRAHRIAWQQLGPALPDLVVVHAVAHDTVLAPWRRTVGLSVLVLVPLIGGIGYVGRRLSWLLVDLEAQRQALASSEEAFRTLAGNLPDPVVRFDAQGRHLYANPATQLATGVAPEAFIGRTNAEMGMPEANLRAWDATLARAMASGEPQRLDFEFAGPHGTRHWESLVVREPAPPGRAATALVISRDITERQRAAAALADSEARLREAHAVARLGHWELDLASQRMAWSDETFRLYGVAPGAFEPGMATVLERSLPEDRPKLQQALERALQSNQPVVTVHRIVRPDGSLCHLQVIGQVEHDGTDPPRRAHGTVQDVTERHEAELRIRRLAADLEQRVDERTAQLALSEQRYRLIFDGVPVAIGEEDWSAVLARLRALRAEGITDGPAYFAAHPDVARACARDVRIIRVNAAAQQLMARHHPPPQAAALQGLEVYYPDEQTLPLFIDELSALWRGDRHYSDKRSVPSQDGPPMKLMLTVALPALDSPDGTALACLVDIGELDRLNAALDRSVARLQQVNEELETFTYSVSHDLKAPLRGIDGYSRLLLTDHRDRLDEEGRAFLDRIRQASQHMGTLIDDLLAYSRLERREQQLGPLPLAPLVQQVLAGFEAECRACGAVVTVDVPASLSVRADAQGLVIALRNLVDNALKFSRDRQPPRLTVRARTSDLGVALSVDDNGVGFDMKYHDRIFAIFQRLQRAEDYPGTGIGLAIVRKAVQRMGGQVRAHSVAGQGASFTIELPAADRPAPH